MGINRHLLSVLAAALSAAVLVLYPPPASAADIPVVEVRRGGAAESLVIEGRIEPIRQATVAAQAGGNVLALLVKAGDAVKAGQPLARIDEREAQAALQRSEAGVTQAEAEARNARVQAERTRELRAQGFVSQAALDVAETQLKAAQAGLAQAQATRTQSALARGFTNVTAPFDGVVLATHIDAGDLAAPGRPIVTVFVPGQLRAAVPVGLSRAAAARGATRVEVELADGRRLTPARKTELASADPVSQTVEWRLDLAPAASAGLVPGQVARAHFVGAAPAQGAEPSGPLRVPQAAVLRRGELTAVFVAQGEGFALRAVRLGADHGDAGVEVLAGLKPGDRIAADALRAGLAGARPAK